MRTRWEPHTQSYCYLRHDVLHLTAGLVGAVVIAEAVQHLLVLELVLVRHCNNKPEGESVTSAWVTSDSPLITQQASVSFVFVSLVKAECSVEKGPWFNVSGYSAFIVRAESHKFCKVRQSLGPPFIFHANTISILFGVQWSFRFLMHAANCLMHLMCWG